MPLSFKQHIENLFKNSDIFSDSEKNLNIPKILEAIEKIDIELIKILKNDEKAKKYFFTGVEDIFVLNQNRLIEFFSLNDYMKNGSYTSYTNKIGLMKKDSFIKKFDDVVLAFPHKDCVLEGGQTKDDDKKQEVFYNEILKSSEIDRLFEPKVLTNIRKFSKDKAEVNPTIKEDDNLIIKGNNLLALHSLKKKFAGKVKLIYIDPPYNTGNDSFNYNDNFNHSTWLTFMKNRLEVAKEFLSDDGVIFVQCDDNEQAYLKVLMDEIFERENFLNLITVKTKIAGVSGSSEGKSLKDSTEFISFYSKNKNIVELNPLFIKTPLHTYIKEYQDTGKSWKYTSIIIELNGKKLIKNSSDYKIYTYDNFKSMSINEYSKKFGLTEQEVYEKNADKIFRTTNAQSSIRQKVLGETTNIENEIVSIEYTPIKGKNKNEIIEIFYKGFNRNMFMFLSDIVVNENNQYLYLEKITTLWEDIQYNNLVKEGELNFANGKKPEALLSRIIELSTKENDLVMDFHLGSGTTCAVAHKMNRRYIGIEQMDYIEDIAVERLKKVIAGEQGGISKAVNWSGGGEFIYAELKTIDNFKNSEIGKLNKNLQYLPISEIEDETYSISKEEIAINKAFYGIENE